MMHVTDHGGLLRSRDGGEQPVTALELFFDLVFVFAVTQLSHRLLDHLTVGSALETLLLLVAVWRAWVDTTWVTNWFDPDRTPVRLMLVAVMLASLLMSVAIPEAFGERGLMFALAYATIQVGRTAFVVLALERSSSLGRNFQRILAWFAIPAVLWVAGGLLLALMPVGFEIPALALSGIAALIVVGVAVWDALASHEGRLRSPRSPTR